MACERWLLVEKWVELSMNRQVGGDDYDISGVMVDAWS
jgi:hypothetical protein